MEQGFIIDGWRVVPLLNQIERGSECHRLKPRSMAVLVRLASAGGDVVPREELMRAVWGLSVVTEDVLTQSIVEIRKVFGDDARHPRVIETIRKVGFRLIANVTPLENQPASPPQIVSAATTRARWRLGLVATAGLLAMTAAWFWAPQQRYARQAVEGSQSIAVMPFANLSGDSSYDYVSHGLSEELLNTLARIPGLKVPARTSTNAIAERNLDAREIGERLGVARILEGSVQPSGNRIRVTAQLIDARTGYHIWSETWDREFVDILAVEDDIAAAITEILLDDRLEADLLSASGSRTGNIEAYDLYLLGKHYQGLGQYDIARERFERAVQADPAYARAYAGLAESFLSFREMPSSYRAVETPDFHAGLEQAENAIDTALRLEPNLVDALLVQAQLRMTRLDFESAASIVDQALAIEPRSAQALRQKGRLLAANGKFGAALEKYVQAREHDPLNPQLIAEISRLKARMGLYQEANAELLHLIESGIRSPVVYETLMQNAEDFGRYEERIRWGRELVRVSPDSASALAELGDAYTLLGMLEVADQWITRAETVSRAQAGKARLRWLWVQHRDDEFLNLVNRMLLATAPSDDTVLSPAESATFGIAGIAKLQGGSPEVASLYLDRLIHQSPTLPYRGIHIVLYAQGVLALAQRASGDERNAEFTLQQAIERGDEALQQTEAEYPPLLRQMAVHHALHGDFEIALGYLRRAIDSGWRAWYLEGRKPGNDPVWGKFAKLPEYLQLKATVEADLLRMRGQVERNYSTQFWEPGSEPLSASSSVHKETAG